MLLTFEINKQNIIRTDSEQPASDSRNYLKAKFDFLTPEWDGLIKSAVFWKGSKAYVQILDENNICFVPPIVISPGYFYVSCFAGDLITSEKIKVRISESGYAKGITPPEPEADTYQKILDMYLEIKRLVQSVRDDADAGAFNGEQGPPGPPGEINAENLKNILGDILNIEVVSTEEEFEDFLANMNTHTLYLINNAIFGHEYYDSDCYVEIIVTEVGENFQFEIVGSTAIAEGVVSQYTYSKQELDNYGVKSIPSPLLINGSALSDAIGVSSRYRDVRFVDENEQPFYVSGDKNNVLKVHFPVEKGKTYAKNTNVCIHRSNPFNIILSHNTEHRCIRQVTVLNLSVDTEFFVAASEFECSLILWVDEENFTLNAPDNIIWVGDDCVDSVFTPQKANYEINIKWLGTKLVARVDAF